MIEITKNISEILNRTGGHDKWRYAIEIANYLENRSKEHLSANGHLEEYLAEHIYFISLRSNASTRMQIGEFSKITFLTNSELLGNRLHRKKSQQPTGFAFADFKGSKIAIKDGRANKLEKKLRIASWQFPHVHAVLHVPPAINGTFPEIFQRHADSRKTTTSCWIKKFNPNTRSLKDLISYSSKGYWCADQYENGHETLWDIFPK